ncbi:MAG: M48 family metallopeptidase [Anaerolineae bacterium]|nr:M48 family metallopeptidase [Anaerolineae bacterium]
MPAWSRTRTCASFWSRWRSIYGHGSTLLNLERVKKPKHCLGYIIVHEMVHLL